MIIKIGDSKVMNIAVPREVHEGETRVSMIPEHVAKLVKAPFFFVAVGSQANVGGAASAPVVASAFNTVLAPVGVLLAVLGYVVGTLGAMICAEAMKWITLGA